MSSKIAIVALLALVACVAAAVEVKPLFLRGRKINKPYKWSAEDLAQIPAQNFASNPFEFSGYFTVNQTVGANMYVVIIYKREDLSFNSPLLTFSCLQFPLPLRI